MRSRSALLLAPWLLVFALFAACDGQGEGQACALLNGNADCQNGLVCKFVQGVSGDRCCPANVSLSTTAVCGVQQNGSDASTAAPPLDGSAAQPGEGGDVGTAEGGDDATANATVGDDGAAEATTAPDGNVTNTPDAASE